MSNTTAEFLFDKTPKTACSGYTNIHGQWINGFPCPIENSIQHFCCITNTYQYCCSPEHYLASDDLDMLDDRILIDDISTSLIENYKKLNKQFEQFQRYFLPTFLLTTTILLLIGIALWFWLYKHKTFYSLGDDDDSHRRKNRPKSSAKKRESINLTFDHPSRFSTTEV